MSYTQVPPNSTGNKIETVEKTAGLHRQVVVIGDDGEGGDIVSQLKSVADSLMFIAAAMLEKLPRVTGNDQMAVSIESGSVGIATNQTLTTLTTLGTINGVGSKYVSGDNLALAGVQHIYSNIVVT